MKLFLGRFVSFLVVAGLWMWVGVRTVLDLIGYSTAPEDTGVAATRLDQVLGWTLEQPWWAFWGSALIATLYLMWVSWPGAKLPSIRFRRNKYEGFAPRLLNIGSRLRRGLNLHKQSLPDDDLGVWAELRACYMALSKRGFPIPWRFFQHGTKEEWYYQNAVFCEGTGALLSDGHIKEAEAFAREVERELRGETPTPQQPPNTGAETQP